MYNFSLAGQVPLTRVNSLTSIHSVEALPLAGSIVCFECGMPSYRLAAENASSCEHLQCINRKSVSAGQLTFFAFANFDTYMSFTIGDRMAQNAIVWY